MGCICGILALVLVLAVAGCILRAACHFANEEVPELGKAMAIVLVVGVIQAVINVVINLAFGIPIMQDEGYQPGSADLGAGLLNFVINIPIAMGLYHVMIPTSSFGKAALVWLYQFLIYLAIGVIILVIVFALAMAGAF